ncbi:15399_t:CDS:2 [Rhizophagus irregularis]|nr:15399_t:CDS:2 [Rhizophagus irregularis]
MTESRTHKYFDRKSSEWNITGFLEECEVESLELKIDRYLKSLEDIIKYEQGNRFQRAQTLLDRYREGTRPDRQVARKWEDGRKSDRTIGGSSIYFHNSTITGNAMINNSGTINERNRERDQEKSASEDPKKSKKRQAEETSPVMTPPPNIRNRSPPPSYYSGNNSLNDYEIADATEASPKTNYRNESNVEITRKEDDNPFDARTDEGSTKYKVVLSWRHAINNMVINNVSENDMSIVNYVLQPEYVECTEKTWNEALPRSLIPKELPTVADLVIIEYNRLLSDSKSLNTKWRSNWSKGNTFTYLSSVSYNDDKKLDEDTFIHRYCHQILEEIFNKTELSLVWANGESESSKERRLLDGHSHGRKPDFRILSKIDDTEREFIFGEIKPPHCPNTINKSIIKLAEFMKGSLDLLLIFTAMWLAWKRMVY